nr:immunoglobulin heavy chain junction region [Macaca mulatta]MOV37986.1 immunoglobulin heavy chain junction region [Macaca mulatta]MOV38050.1 immunoglobulin heavy chain junction region [Macaca mulatta]MOV38070.1 immunoglobulin heavy chain junction region [Macaca mulatta]MOV38092.1 immunoglobulin heavy chain junction region [Macaca mulatta]
CARGCSRDVCLDFW